MHPPLLSLLGLLTLLLSTGCDDADPVPPDPPSRFTVTVVQDTVAPTLPPGSINQHLALDLTFDSDYGALVAVALGCNSVRAEVQKQEGGSWRTVGETGCDEGEPPLVIADGDEGGTSASISVGGLDVADLGGTYRLVVEAETTEGAALPDSLRTSDSFTVTDTPFFPQPEPFAPGIVSSDDEEYQITFTPDGSRAYFARADAFFPASRQATIYETRRVDGAWTAPTVAPFSGTYSDIDPFITPDGSKLFFSSIRPVAGATRTDLDVWYVERVGDGWGEPVHTGALNSPSDELYPSVAADGTLYVGSDRAGGLGGWDIYRAVPLGDGTYGAAENVGAPVNTPVWEFNPAISPDGQTLTFTGLSYAGGAGFGDLYVSTREGAAWGTPAGLGASVNTPADEFHPSFSPDRRLLFFVRRDLSIPDPDGDLYVVSWPLP